MARFFIYILAQVFLLSNLSAESWIALNDQAVRLSRTTNCGKLASKPEEACDCCLLKNTMILKMSNDLALQACKANNICLDIQNSANKSVREASKRMKPFDIVNIVKLPNAPPLPDDGHISADSVLSILVNLSQNDHLPLIRRILQPSIRRSCFKIKALGDAAKGVHTGQLFSISVQQSCLNNNPDNNSEWRNLYILKESKKGFAELHNLYKVKVSHLGAEYVETAKSLYDTSNSQSPKARITFEDLHFKLVSNKKTRYFSLLQTAKGQSLQDMLIDFGNKLANTESSIEKYTTEITKAKTMFYRLGFAMSKLHQRYAISKDKLLLGKTYIHGDFHAQNVFYHEESGDVTLIDNETFSLALKKRSSGVNDIVDLYLLHTVRTVAHQVARQLKTNLEMGISDILWHDLWQYLFMGYLQAYEFDTQKDLLAAFAEFRAKFYEGLSNSKPFDSLKNFNDQRVLKRFGPSFRRFFVRENYLDKTFKALEQTLKIQNLP